MSKGFLIKNKIFSASLGRFKTKNKHFIKMNRRNFLYRSGLLAGASTILPTTASCKNTNLSLDTWADVRAQFQFTPNRIHLSQMLFASHPKPVKEAIDHGNSGIGRNLQIG